MVDKFAVRFGDILPTGVIVEQFFSAKPMESIASWACQLEELLGKIKEPNLTAARGMLRSSFWVGIQSGRIKNALRH